MRHARLVGVLVRYNRTVQIALLGVALAGVLFYVLQFTQAYFDQSKQLVLGWVCFALIYLMYKLKKTKQQPWRLILIILATFITLRYLQWRTLDTLLYTGPLDFIAMSALYAVEVYGMLIFLMGLFINLWPLDSKIIPLPREAGELPTVDVFVPTYNEPDDIVRVTVAAATLIDYPKEKLKVYILDDGGSLEKRSDPNNGMAAWERHYRLRQMAIDLGVGYITRETNQQAKAGNINHALENTHGDLVLVLDCDHVPTKDILQNTVGHFVVDPKLFLVQTPHFFINPTPVEKNLEGMANPSAESDMFYRKLHLSLNSWNASYFCGSAAILRRKCLQEVGGICGTTITEDAETAFRLHSLGYNSIYISRPMVCGLSPESYDDYVVQRSRWAQGMIQMLLLNNPLKTKGLSLPQKIVYFNSCLFWFFGLPRFIYFVAPASYLLLELNIYHASWMQIVCFTLPYVLSIFLVMEYFYKGSRQPFFSSIYESVQSLFLMPAIISVLINPWKPSFKVTPKGLTSDKNFLSPLALPFFLVITINLAALVAAYFKWFSEPVLRDVILLTAGWCVYNLYIAVASLGAFWERKQLRKFYRISASGVVRASFPRIGHDIYLGEVCDVSMTGVGFQMQLPFVPRERELVVLEVKDSYGREFRFENRIHRTSPRKGKYLCGSEFIVERNSYASMVSYVFGDSQRWQDNWDAKSQSHGTLIMLWYFVKTGTMSFVRGIGPLFIQQARQLWRLGVKLTTTPIVREKTLVGVSWVVYFFFISLASLAGKMRGKQVRKVQRIETSGEATIFFPRLGATLHGQIMDKSMTGIGVLAQLPLQIRDGEHASIWVVEQDGKANRFPCLIQRTIKRGDKSLFGAEFIADPTGYPKIVRFVYGDSIQMLRYAMSPSEGLAAQLGALSKSIFSQAMYATGTLLARIFIVNPPLDQKDKP
ncbi:MAG: cellulose synthase [Gallionellaceae bacterium]|nr:MAG: cellulose synthase [Gallionellaceae bacterium]